MVPLMTQLTSCDTSLVQCCHMTKQVMLHLILITLTYGIQWCHLWCHWHHVTPMPVLVVSHHPKSEIAPHFEYLGLRNVMVPLMVQSASCDTDSGANGVTWAKKHVAPHFDCLDLENAVVSVMMPSASCDADTDNNGITWPRKSWYTSFQLSWPKKCNGTIDATVAIMWCWSQCCQMTKRDMLHII